MPDIGPVPPDNPLENHHAVNYALMLDPDSAKASGAVDWKRSGGVGAAPAMSRAPSPELPPKAGQGAG